MEYTDITLDYRDGIALITLNRPKALNAVNTAIINQLHHFFTQGFEDLVGLKGIIITGSGDKAFAAGADIKEFLNVANDAIEFLKTGHLMFNSIEQFHVPVIAAIKGFALGGGCELALACHMRVIADTGKLSFPEVNLGLIPGYGGTQRMSQLVGKARAMELMMTTDMLSAQRTVELGICNHLTTVEETIPKARSIINKISQKGPLAIKHIINSVNACFDQNRDGYVVELEAFATLMKTKDFQEGVTAFVQKRQANFTGE